MLGYIHGEWPAEYPPFEKVLVILRSMEKAGIAELIEMSPENQAYYGQTYCWGWTEEACKPEMSNKLGLKVGDWLYEYASRFVE